MKNKTTFAILSLAIVLAGLPGCESSSSNSSSSSASAKPTPNPVTQRARERSVLR